MENLLKRAHNTAEEYKGRKLLYLLLGIFVVFSLLGFGIGAIIDSNTAPKDAPASTNDSTEEVYYEGKILYVDPEFYPNDNISYALVNSKNETIILLKGNSSTDAKLAVAEGLWGKTYGNVVQTLDGKEDVLIVDRIVLKQSL